MAVAIKSKWTILVIILFHIVLTYTSNATLSQSNGKDTLIKTTEGYVQGIKRDGITQFIGIPYAKPPINELRFEPPQSLDKRPKQDILNATQTLDSVTICPQIFGGDEDCLYLNIFIPNNKKKKKLPVLLWIPGGGFAVGGSSVAGLYDPSNWLTNPKANDVIIVTVNYRLGINKQINNFYIHIHGQETCKTV